MNGQRTSFWVERERRGERNKEVRGITGRRRERVEKERGIDDRYEA
jgi:hypothetical protein